MAAISALNTVALSGYSLPDWVGYLILGFLVLGAFFSVPSLIRIIVGESYD